MSSKKLFHCSAVKLGGVLEVGALTVCNFAVFFCMEFIVLCGFSHDSVLFHLGKPKGHLQCGFASLLSVSVKNPVLRDTLSSSSACLGGMRLPEVMRRSNSLGQILGVLI